MYNAFDQICELRTLLVKSGVDYKFIHHETFKNQTSKPYGEIRLYRPNGCCGIVVYPDKENKGYLCVNESFSTEYCLRGCLFKKTDAAEAFELIKARLEAWKKKVDESNG